MSTKNNFVDHAGNVIEDLLCAETDSHGLMCPEDKVKLNGIEEGAQVNVQSDWNQNDETADDYIKNRTHWEDKDGVVHTIDKKFLPDSVCFDLSDEELLQLLMDTNIVDPAANSAGAIYVDNNNKVYVL